jgi:hypothetical protein
MQAVGVSGPIGHRRNCPFEDACQLLALTNSWWQITQPWRGFVTRCRQVTTASARPKRIKYAALNSLPSVKSASILEHHASVDSRSFSTLTAPFHYDVGRPTMEIHAAGTCDLVAPGPAALHLCLRWAGVCLQHRHDATLTFCKHDAARTYDAQHGPDQTFVLPYRSRPHRATCMGNIRNSMANVDTRPANPPSLRHISAVLETFEMICCLCRSSRWTRSNRCDLILRLRKTNRL